MKEKLLAWIDSGAKSTFEFPIASPKYLYELWKEIGGEVYEETFESNGWQWDWWTTATYKGTDYTLGGCGWDATGQVYSQDEY